MVRGRARKGEALMPSSMASKRVPLAGAAPAGGPIPLAGSARGVAIGSVAAVPSASRSRIASRLADYSQLFKTRVTLMVVLTAWAGFYLGSLRSGHSSIQPQIVAVLLGIGLVSAGAAALNEAMEYRSDARMTRTARRPMVTGRISRVHGVSLALGVAAAGAALLVREANALTAILTLATGATYVLVYTPLKRVTTLATFIGAFPGAMPPLLGWVAARGRIEWPAVALFALLFVWQFPHFMAIAWLYREDYGRAGIRMLPVVQPDGSSTVIEAVTYSVLMVPVSLVPVYLHVAGRLYGGAALLLSLAYLGYTLRFGRITGAVSPAQSRKYARDLLRFSVIYLPVLLIALMLDAQGR